MSLRERAEKLVSNTSANAAVAALGIAATAWYFLSRSTDNKFKGLKEVPLPKGSLPYFGHLLSLEDEMPTAQFSRWHEELGPLITVQMGVKRWISISDPYLANEIFMTNGRYSSDRPFTMYLFEYLALNGKGISPSNVTPQWNKTRAAVVQLLSAKNRERLEKLHYPEADALVQKLLDSTEKNGAVDVENPLQLSSMNVVLGVVFDKHVESIEDPLFKDILHIMTESLRRASAAEEINTFLPILTVIDILVRKRRSIHKFVYEERNPVIDRLIKHALKSDADCMAKSLKVELAEFDDYDHYLVSLADLIFAGTDTTAITLSWMMVILCNYPEVQKKIGDEVDQFIKTHNRLPTFNERDNFPYMTSVQKECMRFRPTTPFGLPHVATADFECNGYIIRKGTTLATNMVAIHLNKEFYTEPEKFIPERFLNHDKPMYTSANGKVEERDHFNFGWGRRVCPGVYLAELEIFNIWVRLLSRCVIEPDVDIHGKPVYPDLDTVINGGIVSMPSHPRMRLVKRADALI